MGPSSCHVSMKRYFSWGSAGLMTALMMLMMGASIVAASRDPCSIQQCLCSQSSDFLFTTVQCYPAYISPTDSTITALASSSVQSLVLTCSKPGTLSSLTANIFEPMSSSLVTLAIEECNISLVNSHSFSSLSSLVNLSIAKSFLPPLPADTFIYLTNLQFLTIVQTNMDTLPDLSLLRSIRYLNVSQNELRQVEYEASSNETHGTDCHAQFEHWQVKNESDLIGDLDKPISLDVIYTQNYTTQAVYTTEVDFNKVASLNCLQTVDLSYNKINSTPLSLLQHSPYLQRLDLSGLMLKELKIPEDTQLLNLTVLNARENRLGWVNLTGLRASSNLRDLRLEGAGQPTDFSFLRFLTHLEELYLINFSLTDAIWQVLNSTVLFKLNLSNNMLTSVNIQKLPALQSLMLECNNISQISNMTFLHQPNLLAVNLSNNNLKILPAGMFKNNCKLKMLDFSKNNLAVIPFNFLQDELRELFFLSLADNAIEYLSPTVFKGIPGMMFLYLNGNKLSSLPNFSYLRQLVTLEASNNSISSISRTALAGLPHLEVVYLNDNKLSYLPDYLLSQCLSLRWADFHNNQISTLGSFGAPPNLRVLRLDDNLLTDFLGESPFVHMPVLHILILDNNRLTTLKHDTFPSSLESLHLARNDIQILFGSSFAGLPRLVYLSLAGNRKVLPFPSFLVSVFKDHSPKPTFDVEGTLFLCDCEAAYLRAIMDAQKPVLLFEKYYPKFIGLDSANCYLPHNNVSYVRPLREVTTREFICDYQDAICDSLCDCCHTLSLSTLNCSCAITCPQECHCMYGGSEVIEKLFIKIHCDRRGLVNVPSWIPPRAVVVYLDGNKLSYISKSMICHLKNTQEIYLNSSSVHTIEDGSFDCIHDLKILYLNDNFLKTVTDKLFGASSNITEIFIHNNHIHSLSTLAFSHLSALQKVTLHNNHLVVLMAAPQLPHPVSITLSGNPWFCQCEVINNTLRSVYQISSMIADLHSMCCSSSSCWLAVLIEYSNMSYTSTACPNLETDHKTNISTLLVGQASSFNRSLNSSNQCLPLMEFSYDLHCLLNHSAISFSSTQTASLHPGFVVLIVLTIFLLTTAVIICLVFFKRQELQAWLYVKLNVRILDNKAKQDKADTVPKIFDAFISHSSKDEEFVARTLLPALENRERKYRVCVHFRDFPVGRNITDSICRAIQHSSRTLLLLSTNFVASEWCRFEFQTAHHHILREGSHKLVLVLLEDIPDDLLDPDLRVLLKSTTYLKFGDPWFWEKLYFALPSVKGKRDSWTDSQLDLTRCMRILAGEEDLGSRQETGAGEKLQPSDEQESQYKHQPLDLLGKFAGEDEDLAIIEDGALPEEARVENGEVLGSRIKTYFLDNKRNYLATSTVSLCQENLFHSGKLQLDRGHEGINQICVGDSVV